MAGPQGVIRRGVINGYDPTTMTASLTPYDNSGIIQNVVCQFERYDPANGAYGIKPPSIGAPCLFVQSGGETFILNTFPPANMNGDTNADVRSPLNSTINRAPSEMSNSKTLPGNVSTTNSLGSEEAFTDSMKKIIIAPGKLSSIWNILNYIWENVCAVFRLKSGAMDVMAETDTGDGCNTTINLRRSAGEAQGTSVISISAGSDADILSIKIDGTEFLHVDADRNVVLTAQNITVNATNMVYNADDLNCLNVGTVELP